jgi:hypothetical protein
MRLYGGETHVRYDTGRKGFELKTSDSRNLWRSVHDIGYDSTPGGAEVQRCRGAEVQRC